jgi:hypothetical protein
VAVGKLHYYSLERFPRSDVLSCVKKAPPGTHGENKAEHSLESAIAVCVCPQSLMARHMTRILQKHTKVTRLVEHVRTRSGNKEDEDWFMGVKARRGWGSADAIEQRLPWHAASSEALANQGLNSRSLLHNLGTWGRRGKNADITF